MKILNDWKDMLLFIKNPSYLNEEMNLLSKLRITLSTFLLKFIIGALMASIIAAIINLSGTETKSLDNMSENLSSLYNPVLIFIMVAIFEEFSFRGFIKKFDPLLFSISIAGIIGTLFKKIVYRNMIFEHQGLAEMIVLILITFVITFLVSNRNIEKMKIFWDKNLNLVIVSSALLFGFIHFFNSPDLNLKYLPTTVNQIIAGFTLSFVRLRSGIIFAILIHFVWNLMIGLG